VRGRRRLEVVARGEGVRQATVVNVDNKPHFNPPSQATAYLFLLFLESISVRLEVQNPMYHFWYIQLHVCWSHIWDVSKRVPS